MTDTQNDTQIPAGFPTDLAGDDLGLKTPRLHVVSEDGRHYDVQARNKDLVLWDRERTRRGWPEAQEAPMVWLNFLAWRVCAREGIIPDAMSLSAFEDWALEVSSGAEPDDVDPTHAAATPG